MKKILIVLTAAAIGLLASGCSYLVPADDLRQAQKDFGTQLEINNQLKEEMRALKEELYAVKEELRTTQDELEESEEIHPDVMAWLLANPPDDEVEAQEDDASQSTQSPAADTREPAAAPESAASDAVLLPQMSHSPATVTAEQMQKFEQLAGLVR